MAKEHWIQNAVKHKGALHKELKVPEGKKIPQKKLEKASHAKGKEGQRARLALTLEHMHKDKKKHKEDYEKPTLKARGKNSSTKKRK